jgi:hypothetical protein
MTGEKNIAAMSSDKLAAFAGVFRSAMRVIA